MESRVMETYKKWLNSSYIDGEDRAELEGIKDNVKEIEERFYKDLEFGTGGMRGIRGVGTNRINKYSIRKATQGLADYILDVEGEKGAKKGVVIAYDCRIGSTEYALNAALVLAGNGIKTYLYESLRSTPELSFGVRELGAQSGIVITASHNPVEYNGYKVYWEDGAQLVEPHASGVVGKVDEIKEFCEIKLADEEDAKRSGLLTIIGKEVDDRYIEAVKKEVIKDKIEGKKEFKMVYSPLHGTGRVGVQRTLKEVGFESVYTVAEQEFPDGNFPTCDYANPEDPKVFELGIKLAEEKGAKICLANDPDADRIGIAVKKEDGSWYYPNGNQVGILLTDYILENRSDIPKNGKIITTVVSTPMIDKIAKEKGVEVMRTLTGFKYIGEKIREFEGKVIDGSYVFGFEESYGYLIGTHARDKDAIVTTMIIAEMAAYYDSIGSSIEKKLEEVYEKYGWYLEGIEAITKKGMDGAKEIAEITRKLRESKVEEIGGKKVVVKRDYELKVEEDLVSGESKVLDLPKSNVIQYVLEDDTYITVRPSGTEPKIKYYYGVNAPSKEEVEEKLAKTMELFNKKLNTL